MSRVLLVDYGVGNLLSVARALEACGGSVTISGDPREIAEAERLVLPGVGAFGDCMAELIKRDIASAVQHHAGSGRPLLGICVGMQVLMEMSEEFGEHQGLGLIPGRVCAIPQTMATGQPHKIPHIGWTPIQPPSAEVSWNGTILDGIEPGSSFYFVHSFTAHPSSAAYRFADADYHGRIIAAAIRDGNIYGTQFHPEKSGEAGLKVLRNFLGLS